MSKALQLPEPAHATWLVYIRPKYAEPIMIDARTYVKPVTGREVLAEFSFLKEYDVMLLPDDGVGTVRIDNRRT